MRFPGLGVMDVSEAQASGGTSGTGAPQPRRFPSEPNGGVVELSQFVSPSPAPRSSSGGKDAKTKSYAGYRSALFPVAFLLLLLSEAALCVARAKAVLAKGGRLPFG